MSTNKNVVITTDSPADLSAELESRYDIHVIPLYVNLGEKSYRDGVDIRTPDIFKHYDETGELPSTSAVPIGDGSMTVSPSSSAAYVSLPPETVTLSLPSGLSASKLSTVSAGSSADIFLPPHAHAAKRARAARPSSFLPISLIIVNTPSFCRSSPADITRTL